MVWQSYRDLAVWQKTMALAVACYRLTRAIRKEELFGLTSQIRRASSSVAANIPEGQGRHSTREFVNYLSIARGSNNELETHLILSQQVGLIDQQQTEPLLHEADSISRMLTVLRKTLEKRL